MKIIYYLLGICCIALFACTQKKNNTAALSTVLSEETYQYDSSDSILTAQIDAFFKQRYRTKRFNGVALFAKSDTIIYHKAFGYANFKTKKELDRNNAFQLASVSKPITALAILKLNEQSKLLLDDTLQQYFPKFPYPNITIRHLLNHRSGLPNYMYFVDKVWENKDSSVSNEEMLEIMIRDKPKIYYSPNTKYNYSNTNYALLASIIEKVSNQQFEDYVQEHIFTPLKMDSSFVFNRNVTSNLPQGVIGYNARFNPKENSYQNGVVGDKGVYASALDLYKLDRGLTSNKLLDKNTLLQAYIPYSPRLTRINRDNYGLGWRIQADQTFGEVVYHSGWWKGFKTYFIRLLDKDQTIIILTNVTRGGFINRIEMQRLLNGLPFLEEPLLPKKLK